jgi:hypothetical protein
MEVANNSDALLADKIIVRVIAFSQRTLSARFLALIWHAVFVGTVFWFSSRVPARAADGSRGGESVATFSALSLIYLVISCWIKSPKSVAPL